MARTMSDEQEREIRKKLDFAWVSPMPGEGRALAQKMLAELDAERAAHEVTKAAHGDMEAALRDRGETPAGWSDFWEMLDSARAERNALKARLALAEAVCDSAILAGPDALVSRAALSAWRGGR